MNAANVLAITERITALKTEARSILANATNGRPAGADAARLDQIEAEVRDLDGRQTEGIRILATEERGADARSEFARLTGSGARTEARHDENLPEGLGFA